MKEILDKNKRPDLNNKISVIDFKDFYWLKRELVNFCKFNGIYSTGGKQELVDRIIFYLQTGRVTSVISKQLIKSKFDWNSTELTLDTQITDNYKNTENVRAFMKQEIGSHFHFTTEFMKWTKQNVGKTLKDAVAEWKRIDEKKKDVNYRTTISSQFEYNTYIRDFLADNKEKKLKDAIHYWKLKRNRRGDNIYKKEDLQLIE